MNAGPRSPASVALRAQRSARAQTAMRAARPSTQPRPSRRRARTGSSPRRNTTALRHAVRSRDGASANGLRAPRRARAGRERVVRGVSGGAAPGPHRECAPFGALWSTGLRLAEEGERPLVGAAILEADEEDPLVPAETELAAAVRDLFGPGAEEKLHEPGPLGSLERDETFEHALEIREESRLALLDADERRLAVRRDVRNPAPAGALDFMPHVVRDVEDRQVRQRRGDRDGNLNRRHRAATSRGSRNWTFSRATVTSSSSSQPSAASRATVAWTSSSGVEAPAVSPIVS